MPLRPILQPCPGRVRQVVVHHCIICCQLLVRQMAMPFAAPATVEKVGVRLQEPLAPDGAKRSALAFMLSEVAAWTS
jgi:hypothetical protein